jgi:hypothetical protein
MFGKRKKKEKHFASYWFFCGLRQRGLIAGYTDISGQYLGLILKDQKLFFFGLLVI